MNSPALPIDIRRECPGADADFIFDQLKAEASIEEVKTAWINTLAARIQLRDEQIEQMEANNERELAELRKANARELEQKQAKVNAMRLDLSNARYGDVYHRN